MKKKQFQSIGLAGISKINVMKIFKLYRIINPGYIYKCS